MLDRLPRPLIIAHRGSSAYAPENTLAAFELAVQQGAPAVELDAKLTSDGEVIVMHDQTVARTTDGVGKVKDFSLAQIQKLDAGAWFNTQYRGECVPTLRQVFDLLKGRALINVELTNYATPADDLVEKVVSLARDCSMVEQLIFSSFSIKNIRKAKKLLPQVPCGLLAAPRLAWPVFWLGFFLEHDSFNPEVRDVSAKLLNAIELRKKPVFVYTVLEQAEMYRLLNLGVDGLFVNDPLKGLAAVGAKI